MRARWLKPEFFTDAKMASLSPVAALVYQSLWIMADDHDGVAPCDPDLLKGQMFWRWSAVGVPEITGALRELSALGRVRFLTGGDEWFAEIVKWKENQSVHKPSQYTYRADYLKRGKELRESVPPWCGTSEAPVRDSPPPIIPYSQTPIIPDSHKGKKIAAEATLKPEANGKPPKVTWLTPYWDAWVAQYDGEPSADKMVKALRKLHDKHGQPDVLARWTAYLAATNPQFASAAKFAETYGSWSKETVYSPMGFADEDFFHAPR